MTLRFVMGHIFVDNIKNDNDIIDQNDITDDNKNNKNNKNNKDNKDNKDKKVEFENIYEEMLKMSTNQNINNSIKRSNRNIKLIRREAIWFDKYS